MTQDAKPRQDMLDAVRGVKLNRFGMTLGETYEDGLVADICAAAEAAVQARFNFTGSAGQFLRAIAADFGCGGAEHSCGHARQEVDTGATVCALDGDKNCAIGCRANAAHELRKLASAIDGASAP